MRWTQQKKRQLKQSWRDNTDAELSAVFGVSADSVRKQRIVLGLNRNRINDCFVIQVTEWLSKQSDTDYQCAHFRKRGIEHIVAKEGNRYAIFRPKLEFLPAELEQPKHTWILHW